MDRLSDLALPKQAGCLEDPTELGAALLGQRPERRAWVTPSEAHHVQSGLHSRHPHLADHYLVHGADQLLKPSRFLRPPLPEGTDQIGCLLRHRVGHPQDSADRSDLERAVDRFGTLSGWLDLRA